MDGANSADGVWVHSKFDPNPCDPKEGTFDEELVMRIVDNIKYITRISVNLLFLTGYLSLDLVVLPRLQLVEDSLLSQHDDFSNCLKHCVHHVLGFMDFGFMAFGSRSVRLIPAQNYSVAMRKSHLNSPTCLGSWGSFYGYIPYIPSWDLASVTSEPSYLWNLEGTIGIPKAGPFPFIFPMGYFWRAPIIRASPASCASRWHRTTLDIAVKLRRHPQFIQDKCSSPCQCGEDKQPKQRQQPRDGSIWALAKETTMFCPLRQSKQVVAHGKGSSQPMFFHEMNIEKAL